LWPFPEKAIDEVIGGGAKQFLSVELNMGQMVQDVRLAVNGRATVDFFCRTGGVLPTPEEVLVAIEALAQGNEIAQSSEVGAVGSVLPHPRHRKSTYERGE
jgi:pyruvate/2-oxoacid:ferredoxin oxidoreductase alpha subunit